MTAHGGQDREGPGHQGPGRQAARRRPHPGTVALGVAVVLGTVLLFWGADSLARWGAQSLLARSVQEATGVPAPPSVRVHGTFVLPQVVQGRYDDVTITVRDVASGPLHVQEVQAELSGVHLSFHDVLVQKSGPVWIERSVGVAFLTYEDLNRYLDATGRPVTIDGVAEDEVRLTGTTRVLGESLSASARARLAPRDGALAVQPTEVDTDTALDPASSLLLGQRFAFLVPLDPLPFGQALTAIEIGDSGLLVRVRGSDVVVRP